MSDNTLPADWAIEKAISLIEEKSGTPWTTTRRAFKENKRRASLGSSAITAFAEYIEKHEEPPVDPALILAREICSKATADIYAVKRFLSGEWDSLVIVQTTLTGIKEGRKLGSE